MRIFAADVGLLRLFLRLGFAAIALL